MGFAWAFPQAGAQNAIASLWEVDDARSVEIMRRLYAGLAAVITGDRWKSSRAALGNDGGLKSARGTLKRAPRGSTMKGSA